MPKYTVTGSDGTEEALNPEGKLTLNNKEEPPARKNSRANRIVVITLIVVCCIVVILLCAWFIYSVFFSTIPEWQQDNYMIESIPGLRHHPEGQNSYSVDTLISFNSTNPNSYVTWSGVVGNIVNEYIRIRREGRRNLNKDCDYDELPRPGEVCIPNVKNWFPCIADNHFGYPKAKPCVFIRFNKIQNWVPEYYNDTSELPEDMDKKLKERIISDYNFYYRSLMKTVWLHCDGLTPADKENMGSIKYIPRPGFPGYFFPFNNTENYMSPLVALYFEKPQTGVLINVECRLWAKNINYDREKGSGIVQFQLQID